MTKSRRKQIQPNQSVSSSTSPLSTDPVIDIFKLSPFQWLGYALLSMVAVVACVWFFYPFLSERHYRDGFQYDSMGLFQMAVYEFSKAVEYTPWETQYLMALAKSYESISAQTNLGIPERLDALSKAESLYYNCIDLDRYSPWQYNRLAAVWSARAALLPPDEAKIYLEKASGAIRQAAVLDSKNPLFQLNYAHHLHVNNRLDEALPVYLKAIEMDPNMMEARYNLADLYRRQGRVDLTLQQYEYILERQPDFNNLRVGLADTYSRMGRVDDAIRVMEDELKSRPDFSDGIQFLIILYSNQQNWKRVSELYFNLIVLNPGSTVFFQPFVAAVRRAGRVDQARSQLTRMVQSNPNPDLLELLRLL